MLAHEFQVLVTATPTNLTFTWSAATDNVGVHHYRLWHLVGTRTRFWAVAADAITNRSVVYTTFGGTAYAVSALDAAGNESPRSAQVFAATLTPPSIFHANPSADQYAAALPVFVKILRQKWPRLPILVTSPFYFPAEETEGGVAREQTAKRLTAKGFVEQRRKGGDHRIWYVDGLKMLNREQTAGLVDGVHCNSLGFFYNALGLEAFLRKALK